MVTLAASRDRVVARRTSDRVMLRSFLEQDRLYAAYAICDLDEKEFRKTRWGVAMEGGMPVAVALEYGGLTPQPLFVMGRNDGISAILRDVIRPRAAFVACLSSSVEAVAEHYTVDPGPTMIRMWVDRASFRPYPADVRRLVPADIGDLNRLYGLGFAAWLPSASIADGIYYGIRVHGRLVAAAGTHVISREAGMGVVGNVLTHPDHRGRGYAKATTSAVTAELLRTCEHVALNVRADNPPAIQAYARLGFQPHVRFEERLAHRLGSPLASLAAPLRRLFLTPREPER